MLYLSVLTTKGHIRWEGIISAPVGNLRFSTIGAQASTGPSAVLTFRMCTFYNGIRCPSPLCLFAIPA